MKERKKELAKKAGLLKLVSKCLLTHGKGLILWILQKDKWRL